MRPMRERPSDAPVDEALLRRIVVRDETAFHLAYRRHAAAVMAIAYRVLRDRDAAAEITQQTFLRLWDRASTLDAREGRLRPWLLLVARNAAIDVGRRKRLGSAALERRAPRADEPDIADTVVERTQARATRDLLAILSDEQRAIVELAYFGGLTQMEIAATLNLPLGTIKSRLRLALKHLRRHASTIGWEIK